MTHVRTMVVVTCDPETLGLATVYKQAGRIASHVFALCRKKDRTQFYLCDATRCDIIILGNRLTIMLLIQPQVRTSYT